MSAAKSIILLASCLVLVAGETNNVSDLETNQIGRSISSADGLVSSVFLDCLDNQQSPMHCIRVKTLEYLESVVPSKRALKTPPAEVTDDGELDARIGERVQRFVDSHQFKLRLPEFFFQGATLVFTPAKSLLDFDVEFPQTTGEQRSVDQARDMKKNMLLPLLMLIKLKLKTIIPILLTVVHVKATKALIMSKLALLLVGGFLAFQILQKKQMMQMMMAESTPSPASAYGPPAPTYGPPTNSYGPPSTVATVSSYEAPIYDVPSSWEPSPAQGPYARVGWDAQSMAYNGYVNSQSNSQQLSSS
ncbi:uncharacterized protein LOC111053614 [Nilaparvata lugens]|uniref:uncharacterized protein LOC111053614 n=1 Tax=Nilaparvata lugens TaxID=108931 RepID=UPI00193C92ED|nr:uncharacterized protein LOC111053614 [Nilaparvata lugens]